MLKQPIILMIPEEFQPRYLLKYTIHYLIENRWIK